MGRFQPRLIHKSTRKERRQARKGLDLAEAGVTEKTRQGYQAGLRKLLPYLSDVANPADLDTAVAEWVQLVWEDGESLYVVSNALCGLHFYEPLTKRCIPTAWRLFATWRKLEWPARAPPLTCGIVYSLAHYAISHHDIFFAALLCLGFFGLLRTGELLALRGTDVLLNDTQLILSLQGTKSGKRNSADETISIEDTFTIMIVQAAVDVLTDNRALEHKFWEYSSQSFRNHFDVYLRRFQLDALHFRPYSLRRGGATHLFQTTGSMEVALVKGRWTSNKVARVYIADGLSKLPGLLMAPATRALLEFWDPRRRNSGFGARGRRAAKRG